MTNLLNIIAIIGALGGVALLVLDYRYKWGLCFEWIEENKEDQNT